MKKTIQKLCKQLKISATDINKVYDTYWRVIWESVRSFESTADGLPISKYSGVMVKGLGKFYDKRTTNRRSDEEVKQMLKRKQDAKIKENKTAIHIGADNGKQI